LSLADIIYLSNQKIQTMQKLTKTEFIRAFIFIILEQGIYNSMEVLEISWNFIDAPGKFYFYIDVCL